MTAPFRTLALASGDYPSGAPLCLLATLPPTAGLTEAALRPALAEVRAKHPYLAAKVEEEEGEGRGGGAKFAVDPGGVTPLTSEVLEEDAYLKGHQAVRHITRRELKAGLRTADTLVRAHLVTAPDGIYLLLLGHSACFDGRSFAVWLRDVLAAASGAFSTAWEQTGVSGNAPSSSSSSAHPFVEVADRLPADASSLPPFTPPLAPDEALALAKRKHLPPPSATVGKGQEEDGGGDVDDEDDEFADAVADHDAFDDDDDEGSKQWAAVVDGLQAAATLEAPPPPPPPQASPQTSSPSKSSAPPTVHVVEDVVAIVNNKRFAALAAQCENQPKGSLAKYRPPDVSLDGALLAAFGAAVIDGCRRQKADDAEEKAVLAYDVEARLDPDAPIPMVVVEEARGGLFAVRGLTAVDLRGKLDPPLPSDYVGGGVGVMGAATGLVPCAVQLEPVGASLWAAAAECQTAAAAATAAGEAMRLADVAKRGAFDDGSGGGGGGGGSGGGEMDAVFAGVAFIWGGVCRFDLRPGEDGAEAAEEQEEEVMEAVGGEFDLDAGSGSKPPAKPPSNRGRFGRMVRAVECHMMGPGAHSALRAHCNEVNGQLSLTITYAPAFHTEETVTFIARRFQEHVDAMSRGPGVYKYVEARRGDSTPRWPEDPMGKLPPSQVPQPKEPYPNYYDVKDGDDKF